MKTTTYIPIKRRLREISLKQTVDDAPVHHSSGRKFLEELQLYDEWQDEQAKGGRKG